MLTDFDVNSMPGDDAPPAGTTRIRGLLDPSRPRSRLRSVVVDIDTRTKLVTRVEVARSQDRRPVARVSFTFQQTGTQPDIAYRLDGHLGPDGAIFGPDQRSRRRRHLIRFFGSMFLNNE